MTANQVAKLVELYKKFDDNFLYDKNALKTLITSKDPDLDAFDSLFERFKKEKIQFHFIALLAKTKKEMK